MISKIKSAVINGLQVVATEVEVGFSQGLPGMVIVGLPDNAVKESKERIRFAIKNSGLEYPGTSKTVINLSPADTKKEGSGLDLPMALGMISQKYGIDFNNHPFSDYLFCGELTLEGKIRR